MFYKDLGFKIISRIKTILHENRELKALNQKHQINIDTKKDLVAKAAGHKALQDENLALQESINKLTEKNVKLRKEIVLFSNELSATKEANKRRNVIIQKQKKIIDILQSKVGRAGNDFEFPIEDLKEKIESLREKIKGEKNKTAKNKLNEDLFDCERRLRDFLAISNKEEE